MYLRFLTAPMPAPNSSPSAVPRRAATQHRMIYRSPDSRVFDVRLRCDGCGRGWRDVVEREATFASPTLHRDTVAAAVEANF